MTSIRYLTVQEIIAINVAMIQRYSPGEQIGVKEPGLLELAVHRRQFSVFGEDAYPTIFEKAAALFESLGLACTLRWILRKPKILQWI